MQGESASEQPPQSCAACGARVEASARYCPSCGRPVAAAAPDVDIAGWLKAGWNLFVNNIGFAIGIPLVVIIPTFAFAFLAYFGFAGFMIMLGELKRSAAVIGLAILGSCLGLMVVAFAVAMPALQAGIYACFLEGIRTGRLTAGNLWMGFRHWWACIWVVWVLTLAALACLPFMFILVGIPALIGVKTLMWLSLFRIVDKRQGGLEALSFAWGIMRGRFWMLLLLSLVALALTSAGGPPMQLATVPIGIALLAAGYDALARKETA